MGVPQNVVIQTINEYADRIQIIINPPPEAGTPTNKQVIAYKVWAANWEFGTYSLVKEWLGYSSNQNAPQNYDRTDVYQSDDSGLTPPVVTHPTNASATNGVFSDKINLAWTNGGVASGTQRFYKVTAINSYGESDLATSLPRAGRRIDTFAGTEVFHGPSSTGPWTQVSGLKSAGYSHTGLTSGQTFYYRLRTASTGGYKSNYTLPFVGSTIALVKTAPAIPTIHTVTEYYDKVRLSINEVGTGNDPPVAIATYYSDQPYPMNPELYTHIGQPHDYTHKNSSGVVEKSFVDVTGSDDPGLTAPTIGVPGNLAATTGAANITLTFSLGAVTPGALRYYRQKAMNPTGHSALGNVQSGRRNDTAQYVQIQHSDDGNEWTTLTATATGPTYTHTGLSQNTTKYYRFRTISAGGLTSAWSDTITGNTVIVPAAPSTPTGLAATPGHEYVFLRWDAQSNVTRFDIFAGHSPTDMTKITEASASSVLATFGASFLAGFGITLEDFTVLPPVINSVSDGTYENKIVIAFIETAIMRGTQIFFAIQAINAGGESAVSNAVSGHLTDSNNGVEIQVSTDDINWSALANVLTSPYEHTGLAIQQTRYYRMRTRALASGRTSNWTASQSGSTGGEAAVAPAAPGNVAATKGTFHDRVRLTWSKVSAASKYIIYVYNTTTHEWDELADVGDVATYDIMAALDTELSAPTVLPPSGVTVSQNLTQRIQIDFSAVDKMRNGATRTYAIKSWNSAGYSSLSAADTGYRADSLPTGGTCVITVSSTGPDGSYSNLYGPNNKTTSPAFHNYLADSATRHYKLKLVSVNGYESEEAGPHEGTTAAEALGPDPPENLTATAGNHVDKVVLAWDAVIGATGYRVYASLATQPYVWTLLGTVTGAETIKITADGSAGLRESRLSAPTVSLPQNIAASQGTWSDKIRLTWVNGILTQGTSIAFAMTAYNADGESEKSNVAIGYRKGTITGTEIIVSQTQSGTYIKLVEDDASPYDHEIDELTGIALLPNTTKWYKLRMIVE